MATIANLSIGLSADSAKLKKDLDKAGASTKKWSHKQKKNFGDVTKAIKGMGLALGALGAIGALRGMTELAREVTNLATLTNMSTDELQQLEPALRHIGMSTEKYADILKDVNDKMHDFHQTGAGPMKDFFEQIAPKVGITAEAFKDLSGSDALGLYVKSLEDANLSQEEMTFYMEAIASDSTMLLPLLRDNAAEMTRLGLAAHQMIDGSVLDDLTNLGTQVRTIGIIIRNTITNALGPLINFLAEAAEGWRMLLTQFPVIIQGLGLIAAAIGLVTMAMLANPILAIVAGFLALVTAAGYLYKKFMDLADAVGGVSVLFGLMKDAALFEFSQIAAGVELMGVKMAIIFNGIQDKWNNLMGNMRMRFAEFVDMIAATGLGEMVGLTGGSAEGVQSQWSDRQNALTDEFISLQGRANDLQSFRNADNPFMGQILTGLSEVLDPAVVSDAIEEGVVAGIEAVSPTGGGGGSVTPVVPTVEPTYFENAAESFVGNLKTSFSDALKTGDIKGFFTSVLDNFTSSIIDSFVEGLFAPLQESLTQSISGIFSGVGGLGGGGGGFLSGLFGGGGFLGGLFGAADGGMVPTTPFSKSYADSVPTMLQPGELVVPKDQVGNFMGGSGGGQTFNINVTGDVSRLTRSEIVRMMPEIAAGTNMVNRENNLRG